MTEKIITINSILRDNLLPKYRVVLDIAKNKHGVNTINRTIFDKMKNKDIEPDKVFCELVWDKGCKKTHGGRNHLRNDGGLKNS